VRIPLLPAGRRELLLGITGVLSIWAVEAIFLLADRERGAIPLIAIESEVRRTKLQIAQFERRRDELRVQSTRLTDDWYAIEAAAREELGMVFPGERVLRIPENVIAQGAAQQDQRPEAP
jgi:cell division protein FtsB